MHAGTVAALRRYPVKSMRAEELRQVELHWTGLYGDRRYAFVRTADRTHFPWLTGRQVSGLVLHRAQYSDPADPRRAQVRVTAPDGQEYDAFDPLLAERLGEAAGEEVRIIQIGRGAFDAMPVSVLTTTTVEQIGQAHGAPVGPARFRSNILIEPPSGGIGTERDWTGHGGSGYGGGTATLQFGDGPAAPRIRLDWAIPRCAMVAIDPDTAAKDAKVLRTVVQRFANEVGTYCAVEAVGTIAVGEPVYLLRGPA